MAVVDERLIAMVRRQLAERQHALDGGARHVGWKLGMGERESVGGHIAVGHITSKTVLESGSAFAAEPGAEIYADVEASVELAGPEDIAAYGVALEIVDLAPLPDEPESVVVSNVFHCAVAFGPLTPGEPLGTMVSLRVNGAERASGWWPNDLRERIAAAGEILDAAGEQLRTGDRIITGSIVQVALGPGDRVAAVIGEDAAVTLQIA
jgi:2-keto-4-pentenoate hydratase